MSRTGSGAYSVVNTFVEDTTISPDEVNQNFDDLGDEIANSLALDGQSSMTGQIKAAAGSQAAPGYSWANELGSGFYRAGSGDFRYAVAGADVFKITSAGVQVIGTLTATFTIADGSVTTAKLADANVTGAKLANTAVTAGSYTRASITVDAQGRLTGASNGASELPSQTGNSGKFLTTDGSTTSWGSASYSPPTAYGAVGTYVFGYVSGGVSVNAGSTINAASNTLHPSDSGGGATGVGDITSGVFRCMGCYSGVGTPTLWFRVS